MQRVALVLLALGFLFIGIQLWGFIHKPHGHDFTTFLLSSRAMMQGTSPYDTGSPHHFIYPMFFAVAMIPFAILPNVIAEYGWFLLNIAFLAQLLYLIIRRLGSYTQIRWEARLLPALLLIVVVQFGQLQLNLGNGNVNILIALLCLLFIECLLERKLFWASVALAAAISIKLLPLFFIPFLLFRREFRTLFYTASVALCFWLLPFVFLGAGTLPLYKTYLHRFVLSGLQGEAQAPSSGHQLAEGGAMRVADPSRTHYFSLQSTIVHCYPPARHWKWLPPVLALLLLAGLCALDRRARGAPTSLPTYWVLLLYLTAILLLDPFSEPAHLGLALPAFVALVYYLWFNGPWRERTNAILLALLFLNPMLSACFPAGAFNFLGLLLIAGLLTACILLLPPVSATPPEAKP